MVAGWCAPHNIMAMAMAVRNFLDNRYGLLIGKNGNIEWAAPICQF